MGRGKTRQKDSLIRFSVSTLAKNIPSKDGKPQSDTIGSGIIITHNESLYLITAGHCNPTGALSDLTVRIHYPQKDIPIEINRQICFRYKDSSEREGEDIAIYSIKQPNDKCHIDKVVLSDWEETTEPENENIAFGFPKENRYGTSFELKYKGNGEWYIDYESGNPSYDAKSLIEGISGSGIIDFRENEIFCIGIIRCFSTKEYIYSNILGIKSDVILQLLPEEKEEGVFISDKPLEVSNYIARLCRRAPVTELDAFYPDSHPLSDFIASDNCGKGDKHFILAGEAQTGKTSELQHTAYILDEMGIKVKLLYLDQFPELTEEDLDFYPDGVLMLDALDEVKSSKLDSVAMTIAKFATAHPNRKIVVSCRENFIDKIDTGNFKVLTLNDLTQNQVNEYIKSQSPNPERVYEEINKAGIQELCTNPSNLRCILSIGEDSEDGFILPKSKIEIYEKFVEKKYQADLTKPSYEIKASREENLRHMKEMAYYMIRRGKTSLTHDDLLNILGSEASIDELIKNNVVSHPDDEYSFISNGIREYLAAEKLLDLNLKGVKDFVCFEDSDKIRPKMHNTVRLWLNHLSEKSRLTDDIIKWILDEAPHLLLDCVPSTIPLETRLNVVFGILDNCVKLNSLYSSFYLGDYHKLLAFADSPEFREYLLQELKRKDINGVHLYNIVCICACLPWETFSMEEKNDLTPFFDSLFEKIKQYGNEDNSPCLYYWIAYNFPLFSNQRVTDKLIDVAGLFTNPHIMSIICEIIFKGNVADRHFDYLLSAEDQISDKGYTIIPRTNLYAALGSVKQPENVNKCIDLILCEDFLRKEYSFTDEIFKMTCELFSTLINSGSGLEKYRDIFDKTAPNKKIRYLNDSQKNILMAMEKVNSEMNRNVDFSEELHELLHPTPPSEEEINRRIELEQRRFELIWNYNDFKKEIENTAAAMDAYPHKSWDTCYESEEYGYNPAINEFIIQFCGWKNITSDKVRAAIDDEEVYKRFRMEQTVRHIDSTSSVIKISDDKINEINTECEQILTDHVRKKREIEYRYVQVALKMFVKGDLRLEEDVIKGLLGYSFESFYVGFGDKREKGTVFDAIYEILGKEKFLTLLRSQLRTIIESNNVIMQATCSFIMENGTVEDRNQLYDIMTMEENENLTFLLLDDFLCLPEYRSKIVEDYSKFSPYDKISIWEKLKDVEEYKYVVTEMLEQEVKDFPDLPRMNALQKLTREGSMYALNVISSDLDIIKEKGEFFLFYYSVPEALDSLLEVLALCLHMGPLFETTRRSLVSSIGNIAAAGSDVEKSVKTFLGESSEAYQLINYCKNRRLDAIDNID